MQPIFQSHEKTRVCDLIKENSGQVQDGDYRAHNGGLETPWLVVAGLLPHILELSERSGNRCSVPLFLAPFLHLKILIKSRN